MSPPRFEADFWESLTAPGFVNFTAYARALQGRDKEKVLRRFNPDPGQAAYRRAVMRYYRQLKRQG